MRGVRKRKRSLMHVIPKALDVELAEVALLDSLVVTLSIVKRV